MKRRRSLVLSLAVFSTSSLCFAQARNSVIAPPPPPPLPPPSSSKSVRPVVGGGKDTVGDGVKRLPLPPPPPPPKQSTAQPPPQVLSKQLSKLPPPPPPLRSVKSEPESLQHDATITTPSVVNLLKSASVTATASSSSKASNHQALHLPPPPPPQRAAAVPLSSSPPPPPRPTMVPKNKRLEVESSNEILKQPQRPLESSGEKDDDVDATEQQADAFVEATKETKEPLVSTADAEEEEEESMVLETHEPSKPDTRVGFRMAPPPPPPRTDHYWPAAPAASMEQAYRTLPIDQKEGMIAEDGDRPLQSQVVATTTAPPVPTRPMPSSTTVGSIMPPHRSQSQQQQQGQFQQQPQYQRQQQPQQHGVPPQALARPQHDPVGPRPPGQQQQQQRPQHQRVRPSQMMQDYSRRRVPAPPPPAWKRLWTRVEQGLDGLADLESSVSDAVSGKAQHLYSATVSTVTDVVSDKAQHLYSATVSSVKIPTWKSTVPAQPSPRRMESKATQTSSGPPATAGAAGQTQANGLSGMSVESFVMRKSAARASTKAPGGGSTTADQNASASVVQNPAERTSVPASPYELLLQKSFAAQPEPTGAANAAAAAPHRKIGLNHLMNGKTTRMIRANGGASTPHPDEMQSVASVAPQPGQQGQPPNAMPPPSSGSQQQQPVSGESNQGPTSRQGFSGPSRPLNQQGAQPLWESRPTAPRPSPLGNKSAFGGAASGSLQSPKPSRSFLDDDDEEKSWMAKLGRVLPPIPRMPSFRFRHRNSFRDFSGALDAWKDDEDNSQSGGFLGRFRGKKSKSSQGPARSLTRSKSTSKNTAGELTPPLAALMGRCRNGKSTSLLTAADESKCVSFGRSRAILDLLFLTFVLIGARQLSDFDTLHMPHSIAEIVSLTVPSILSSLATAMDTWAPYAFVGAFLAVQTNSLLFNLRVGSLVHNVGTAVRDETQYGMLFLRLLEATPSNDRVPERMESSARAQIMSKVGTTRLRTFVGVLLSTIVLMTVSFIRPLIAVLLRFPIDILSIDQLRTWPVQWQGIAGNLKGAMLPIYETVRSLVGTELNAVVENPLKIAYEASVFAALVGAAFLPILESRRKVQPKKEDDSEEDAVNSSAELTRQVANLGISGTTRLGLLSDDSAVERVLERWRMLLSEDSVQSLAVSAPSLLRLMCYGVVSGAMLTAPLLVYGSVGISSIGSLSGPVISWDSLFNLAAILLFTHRLVWKAVESVVHTNETKRAVAAFLGSLAGAVKERTEALRAPPVNLQLQASVSPTAGLVVKDLWAAHTTKRAWAIRGANIACRNGEVLVILGDDGSSKTRLLTTLAESMLSPPKRTLSTNRVRGSVTFGNLDVVKWDKIQLKRRTGILLNDVRTASDTAQVLSGLTLEEVLEPADGLRTLDPSHNPGASERACMTLALKITGLYSTLLPKLQSKLSTVVTANEEDLKPSALKPRYNVLSPSEWSKLLLARVLSQAIYDNENSASTNENIENSLIGSILLLDDVFALLSEIDEARIIRDLRLSGAATVFATNRWATGRFADRIVVVKGGTVVESGTHSELLNRGPQQSIYAAKWHAMTTQ